MEWPKLKNIILFILLTVNALLLAMVLVQEYSSESYQEQAMTDALAVLERGGIRLAQDVELEELGQPMSMGRDREEEPALAAALLGPVVRTDLGSGRHSYRSAQGAAEFRSNGNFSFAFQPGALTVNLGMKLQTHALNCMEQLGFHGEVASIEESEGLVTLRQLWEGTPVFSNQVTLTYENGSLISIAGERLLGSPEPDPDGAETITGPTALLRFLTGVTEMGDICSEITEIQAGYLCAAAENVRMTPVWQIRTDTGSYFLNGITGELVRESS